MRDVKVYQQLQDAYQTGEVCLFVGAGVAMGCGLPDWRGLAEKVVRSFPRKPGRLLGSMSAALQRGEPPPHDPNLLSQEKANVLAQEDPLLSMRYARCERDFKLESLVSKCLYDRPIALSETVREIVSLEKVKRICCFNYDDILDRAFSEANKAYVPLFPNDRIPLEAPETLVFYPHGFLPDPKRQSYPATRAIVLSEDDYFDLYRSPYAWANIVQLMLLLNYSVLFIGCSLLDPNVRRLLDTTARMRPDHSHFAIFRDPYHQENAKWYQVNYDTAYQEVQELLLRSLSVQAIWVHNYSEIAEKLRKLRT